MYWLLSDFSNYSSMMYYDMIVGYTKLYSHREKAEISYEIINKKFAVKCIGDEPWYFCVSKVWFNFL